MDKINPAAYLTDDDPVNEAVLDSSNWYEWQGCEVEDGAQLPWLLASGWVISATTSTYDVGTGRWTVVKWYLKRRVLKPELALRDLIGSFTNAYNEGRRLNDQRYDDIVALYSVMLDKTEDTCISLEADETTYEDLIETILSSISSDFTSHNTDVSGDFDTYGASERARITTQFDAKLASAQASLVARGLYNTTVWNAVEAGIERERAVANTDLEDKILDKQVALADRLYVLKTEMRTKILAARDRLRTSMHELSTTRDGLRNAVVQALTNFAERREDGYPDMAAIGQLTAQLGASGVAYPAP
jgi:hypothetical protein